MWVFSLVNRYLRFMATSATFPDALYALSGFLTVPHQLGLRFSPVRYQVPYRIQPLARHGDFVNKLLTQESGLNAVCFFFKDL